MDQTVNARDDLSECTERHELQDANGSNVVDLVVGGEYVPRIVLRTLVAQGNLLVVAVQTDNVNVNGVADIDNLRRVLDAAPGQLGDVDHTVNTADINECAVGSQGLYGAGVLLAYLDLVPDLLSSSAALFLSNGTDGADNALSLTVDLGDAETGNRADQLAQRLTLRDTGLACRDEYAYAECACNNAALVLFADLALDNGLVFLGSLDGLPALHLINALLGQNNGALCIVDADNNRLDLVARLNAADVEGRVVGQLMLRDVSGMLDTQINLNLILCNLKNGTGYLISCI